MAQEHTLFLACTRPAMWLGIPIVAAAAILVFCAEVFVASGLFTHSIWRIVWSAALTAVCYGSCRLLTAIDHNIFRILVIWITTKGRASRNSAFWGGSSSSHMPLRRARRPQEIPFNV